MSSYKLMPVKPTPEMISEGARHLQIMSLPEREAASVFRAMSAVAPVMQREPVGYVDPEVLPLLGNGFKCLLMIANPTEQRSMPLYTDPQPAEQGDSLADRAMHACITYVVHGDADFSGQDEGLVRYFKEKVEGVRSSVDNQTVGKLQFTLAHASGVTPAQGARIAELLDKVRAADAQDPYWSESSRTARDTARRNYLDYINEIGATKSDLFRMFKGIEPCCEDYQPESMRAASAYRASDGTLYSTAGILWCRNCGALIRNGIEVTRPRTPNDQTAEQQPTPDVVQPVSVPEIVEAVANFVGSQKGGPFTPAVMKAAIIGQLEYGDAFTKLFTAPQPVPDISRLVEALEQIGRWDGFPSTDKTWEGSGEPVSYGAAFGSNGERDFMREVARKALAAYRKGDE